jgi:hypothetical protein
MGKLVLKQSEYFEISLACHPRVPYILIRIALSAESSTLAVKTFRAETTSTIQGHEHQMLEFSFTSVV